MTLIMNAWYVAAWPEEVPPGEILSRTVCNEPMVLFRDREGRPAALEDRCCHRQMPLALGRLEQDCTLRCMYHGLRFEADGSCVEAPGQANVPAAARVRAFPCVERHGYVWVWPGEAELADPDLIQDIFERNDHPDWTSVHGTIHLQANYTLLADNLIDTTHETYVHIGSLGDDNIQANPISVTGDEKSVLVTRWILDHDAAPLWREALNRDGNVDRWQIIRFQPPASTVLDVGVAPVGTGAPGGDRSHGAQGCNLNFGTPETEHTTWYFWAFARKFRRDEPGYDEVLQKKFAAVFAEDSGAIEGAYSVMRRNPGRPTVNLRNDAGTLRARRLVEEMAAAEAARSGRAG